VAVSGREAGRRLPLFAYGTLTSKGFVESLLEHGVVSEPARLFDFELLELTGFGYPSVFAAEGESVKGRLYRGLSAQDLERLDAYEGVAEGLYARVTARVVAAGDDRREEDAFVYVVTEKAMRRALRSPG
jgi:gamma-glutamylcyclotransferase (GGCT)/AIG2-like uncharacterized protein YtfP